MTSADVTTGQGDDEQGDADVSSAQAELEDHGMPSGIATPDIPWHPFPHVFKVPLSGSSFVRDQLRPPPLA